MCGRYASYRRAQELADAFDVDEVTEAARAVAPSYNVAPTQDVRIVLGRTAQDSAPARREMHAARWGLVPAWANDLRVGYKMINARVESLADKPAFSASLARRRCVVPADGYYEWQRVGRAKTPFYIHGHEPRPLALAGLYAFWRDPEKAEDDPARWLLSATVITTAATGPLARLHDRVPVVLAPGAVDAWLTPDTLRPGAALGLLLGAAPRLDFHAVSDRVNRATEDDADLIAPR